jgi:hypothetical protein|tara:strand:- start:1165 stop:1827 length:663 start_codon:yes stop_codon:yes gene_type:complete
MTEQTLATTGETDSAATNSQVDRVYTQKEVDDMMARTKTSVTKKMESRYADLGDPDQLREVLTKHNQREQENAMKRGDFEKVLQDISSKKDAEIQKRDRIIEEFKLNTPVIDAAAKHRAVNPEQVKALIRNNLRLNPEGEVEVLDTEGKVRYDDSGRPVSVDNFVQSWLQQNPHFVNPTPGTGNIKSGINYNPGTQVDLNKLDMKNPEHRKIYAESRKTR